MVSPNRNVRSPIGFSPLNTSSDSYGRNVPVAGSHAGATGAESSNVTSTLGALAGFVYVPDARSVRVVPTGEVIDIHISDEFALPVHGLLKFVPSIDQKSTRTSIALIVNHV